MPQSHAMTAGAVAFTYAPALRPIRKISLDRSNKGGNRQPNSNSGVQGWARAFLREGL